MRGDTVFAIGIILQPVHFVGCILEKEIRKLYSLGDYRVLMKIGLPRFNWALGYLEIRSYLKKSHLPLDKVPDTTI